MFYTFDFDLERESNQTPKKNIPITKNEKRVVRVPNA